MFNSSPLGLPTHNIDSHYGKPASLAYSSSSSPLRTLKQSLEIILSSRDSKQIFYFLLLNLSYMFVQLTYGVWTNSLGLISDAIHMFFDCLALGVGLFAAVMSKWPSNPEFSYGYSRIETVAAYFNSVFLVLISISIIAEAIQRLIVPPEMSTHRLLFISTVGLIVNLVGIFAFNHGHAHGGHGHDHGHDHSHGHSANMQGVFLHIMADTLGSVGVIVSTLLIKWFGWTGFDPIASLFIATLIILSVIPLIRQSSAVMMLELDDKTAAAVEGTLEQVRAMGGIYSISHVRFWPCEAESVVGSLHVQVKDEVNTQEIRQAVTDKLMSHIHGLKEVCVQIELQSAVRKNRFAAPQRGLFHTPVYNGFSSTSTSNNTYINHRAGTNVGGGFDLSGATGTTGAVVAPAISTSSSSSTNISAAAAAAVSAVIPSMMSNSTPILPPSNLGVMSVLQKQSKKE